MTLFLGLAFSDGVWMSTDFRVSRWPTGDLIDNRSHKVH
jgi:hypothetical protein